MNLKIVQTTFGVGDVAHVRLVGVPGHVVRRQSAEHEQRRHAIAQKIGFDAYGTSQNMPDPVANAVNCMLDHIHVLDTRIETMCAALKALGADLAEVKLPSMAVCEIEPPSPAVVDSPVQPAEGDSQEH